MRKSCLLAVAVAGVAFIACRYPGDVPATLSVTPAIEVTPTALEHVTPTLEHEGSALPNNTPALASVTPTLASTLTATASEVPTLTPTPTLAPWLYTPTPLTHTPEFYVTPIGGNECVWNCTRKEERSYVVLRATYVRTEEVIGDVLRTEMPSTPPNIVFVWKTWFAYAGDNSLWGSIKEDGSEWMAIWFNGTEHLRPITP